MLKVKKLAFGQASPSFEEIARQLSVHCSAQDIGHVNWPGFPYKPEVSFLIGHGSTEIYLQYNVRERNTRAIYLQDNDPVWNDSCVEFFFSPGEEDTYYNLEVNCIGTLLLGYGRKKPDRERAGQDVLKKIRRISSLKHEPAEFSDEITWSVALAIPVEVFYGHAIHSLSGMQCRANFYKCGDEMKVPHYLSWQPINTDSPNFHLPEFFGTLFFE